MEYAGRTPFIYPRVFFELIGFYAIFVIVFIKNTNV